VAGSATRLGSATRVGTHRKNRATKKPAAKAALAICAIKPAPQLPRQGFSGTFEGGPTVRLGVNHGSGWEMARTIRWFLTKIRLTLDGVSRRRSDTFYGSIERDARQMLATSV
jgi:hypothetical protein